VRETRYPLCDRSGKVVAVHVREDKPGGGKDVKWQRPDGKWGLNGTKLPDLPLYGIHVLDPEAMLVVVCEGEKARDALADALKGTPGVAVVATVTGAGSTPSKEVLETLRGHEVVLWPDADDPGRAHMQRVAERLQGIAALVRVYGWPEAPEKGDAFDHPAVQGGGEKALDQLLNDLCGAPAWKPPEPSGSGKPGGQGKAVPLEPKSAAELLHKEFPAIRWAVPDVLPEGVLLLAGKPKMGKSWLGLGMCIAVAAGGCALGKIPVEKGEALYLALEDNERRLQRRLKKVLAGGVCPAGLAYATEWPRINEGGLEALDAWLTKHPNARIVVIDTLKKFRPQAAGNRSLYDVDYEALEPLLPLAAKHEVAILVVHHLRKMDAGDPLDMVSGSTGLTGGVDGTLILKRERGKQDATLVVDGRDLEESSELALKWDANIASWSLMGDAEEARLSGARGEIIALLREQDRPMTPKEIALMLGKGQNAVYQLVYQMSSDGQLSTPDRGLYDLPPSNKVSKGNKDNKDNKVDKDVESLFGPPCQNKDANKDENPIGKGDSEENAPNLINLIGEGGSHNGVGDEYDRRALEALRLGNGPRAALEHHRSSGLPFEQVIRAIMVYLGVRHDPLDDWEAAAMRAVGVLDREESKADPLGEERI
jgi:hypothetical protein